MTEDKRYRAIGYTRVSSLAQANEGFSLENQEYEIKNVCKSKGWELVDIISDAGISGIEFEKRPGINKVLRELDDKNIDYIVVTRLSRLSRRLSDICRIADHLESHDKYLYINNDSVDTRTSHGSYFLYFSGIFAEVERENMIEQVVGGMSQKARNGEWNGGDPPLGYDLINKLLVVNEDESAIVKLIYTEYLKGNGYSYIARKLTDMGYKTKLKNNFNVNGIRFILTNPTYKGDVRWSHCKDWGKKGPDGKRKRQYNDNPIHVKGIHEYIIDPETYDEVQRRIMNNPRSHLRRTNKHYLLSGLLRCPQCGYGMSVQKVSKPGKNYYYYVCNRYQNNKSVCAGNHIVKEDIEREFFEFLKERIRKSDISSLVRSSTDTPDQAIYQQEYIIKTKEGEMRQLDKKIMNLSNAISMTDNEAVRRQLVQDIEDKMNQKQKIEHEIEEHKHNLRSIRNSISEFDEMMSLIETRFVDILSIPGFDSKAKQEAVRKLVRSVETQDKKITKIHFTFENDCELSDEGGALS